MLLLYIIILVKADFDRDLGQLLASWQEWKVSGELGQAMAVLATLAWPVAVRRKSSLRPVPQTGSAFFNPKFRIQTLFFRITSLPCAEVCHLSSPTEFTQLLIN